ncbi:MAG: FecR domain-containing protein [Spirochaetales bacterium]|uniref:FecR domain-containing protein n=1 Tax=Candidatus Thalassospirochaeta sargassi TaxID=3119039 RepID=A0AAJ1IHI9_9SPIO|nr:FecR domain-containing protein [Spirochaetales bacterium]
MKKLLIILVVLLAALPLFAENAVVKETSGRVEIQLPGSSWQTASVGDSLPKGASISTGFGASAVLDVGASTLTVDALTRMKLEELIESQGAQTTGLFLRVGKVKAEVKRDQNLSHDFRLRSPSSTAAVRGTEFTFDGNSVKVSKGVVALISASIDREVLVAAGESCTVSGSGKPNSPLAEKLKESTTQGNLEKKENSTAQNGSFQGGNAGGAPAVDLYGDISITVVE